MLYHYIKIAFRNLLKYKLQSFICIVGLAIGFTSFALSSLWIRYELTYDTFRKDADRIYYVRMESETDDQGLSSVTPYPLARYLKETFPELEVATRVPGKPISSTTRRNTNLSTWSWIQLPNICSK